MKDDPSGSGTSLDSFEGSSDIIADPTERTPAIANEMWCQYLEYLIDLEEFKQSPHRRTKHSGAQRAATASRRL